MTDSQLLTAYGQHGNIAGLRNVASIAGQLAVQQHLVDANKMIEQFGYFRPTIDGWEDCAKDDVGSRPLYENSLQAWQPIETAPRDKTFLAVLDCAGDKTVCTMRWNVAEAKNSRPDCRSFHCERVTHWMPLPEPPK